MENPNSSNESENESYHNLDDFFYFMEESYPSQWPQKEEDSFGLYSDGVLKIDRINPLEISPDPNIFNYIKQTILDQASLNNNRRPKMNRSDNQLFNFFKRNKEPKIEYFRTFLIRLLKKMIRTILFNNFQIFKPSLNEANAEQVKHFLIIKHICNTYSSKMRNFSDTIYGPETDGKSKKFKERKLRTSTESLSSTTYNDSSDTTSFRTDSKTYNNKYIRVIFQDEIVRGIYKAFIDYLFEVDFQELIHIFNFSCCEDLFEHTSVCVDKWKNLKNFCLTFLVGCEFNE